MGKIIDLSGRVFGKLTVLSFSKIGKDNKAWWKCQCECGNIVDKSSYYLRKRGVELLCGDAHPTKICTKCKKEKNKETDYHKSNLLLSRINPKCKECIAEFYQDNKDKFTEDYHKKRSNSADKEHMRKIRYKSWKKNRHKDLPYKRVYNKRPEVIERRKKRHAERKETDIQYNIKRRLRGRVRDCLKSLIGTHYKYKSSLLLLGCDMPFFKSYIESKFEYGMNWDRFAYIHIDHIVPCSQFDMTSIEDQKKCFHYTNMQPLWEVDNLRKSYIYSE